MFVADFVRSCWCCGVGGILFYMKNYFIFDADVNVVELFNLVQRGVDFV